MTYRAEVQVDPHRSLGQVDPWIYGQFIEHVGRSVYGGIFDPGSPLSDPLGYRSDVIEAAKGLGPTVLRWPGGNFASGYHWRDGIGSREHRPRRRDLAWSAIDDNTFGTEEFLEYCRRLGAEPYIALNMGTGTVDEALQWLEYCNAREDGIPEVALRKSGPHSEPHNVRVWGLGNEVYGWWQHGHTSAGSYAEAAREWAKLLRWTDPAIRLVAVGGPDPDWNWTVLKAAGRWIDYLSLHFYWHGKGDADEQYDTVLSGPASAEEDLLSAWGMCLAARKKLNSPRQVSIAVDEWGVWTHTYPGLATGGSSHKLMQLGLSARAGVDTRFEEPYDLKDALAVATWLHVLWRHPDKVKLATQAQMVNVLAPILTSTNGILRQTIWWPLAIARAVAGPEALDLAVRCRSEVAAPEVSGGSLPALDAAGTFDSVTGRIHVSVVNRSRTEECEVAIRLPGGSGPARVTRLWHEDPFAGNSAESPDRIAPVDEKVEVSGGLELVLAPHSHTTVEVGAS